MIYRTHKGILQVVMVWKTDVHSKKLETLEQNEPVTQLQVPRAWKPTAELLGQAQVQSWRERGKGQEQNPHFISQMSPVIPGRQRPRLEDFEFQTGLDYIKRPG